MKFPRLLRSALPLTLLLVFAPCCGGESSDTDSDEDLDSDPSATGGQDAIGDGCTDDDDCDNGVFCDGVETCSPSAKNAEERGCLAGAAVKCAASAGCEVRCVEDEAQCVATATDEDGDGHESAECEDAPGDDCDDSDEQRFPGNSEVCDFEGHDEDCDPGTIGGDDFDRDGEVDARCCNKDPGEGETCGTDCDDLRQNVGPKSSEVCDGFDNDCDGDLDEGVTVVGYVDGDLDLVGDVAKPEQICAGTSGYSTVPGDCDDANPQRSPLYAEACDGVDNDCDGQIDEDPRPVPWYDEQDADVYGSIFVPPVIACDAPDDSSSMIGLDCNDEDDAVGPFATEKCDGVDNNCNGFAEYRIAPGDYEDDDGDSFADASCDNGTDCDDEDPTSYPGAPEREDGRDNDCNGKVDDKIVALLPWYKDKDNDGFGLTSTLKNAATQPNGFSALAGECDDNEGAIHPFAREECNAIDDNCNGQIDEGAANLEGGACLVCDHGTWDHDQAPATTCEVWTDCVAGEFISVSGSSTVDQECTGCPDGTFSASVNQEACVAHTVCELSEEPILEGTATSDATCKSEVGVPSLWLDAGRNVFSDAGITQAVDGANLRRWQDRNGGRTCDWVAGVISWKENLLAFNNHPVVRLDGGYLLCADASLQVRTIFMVVNNDGLNFGWYPGLFGKKGAGSIAMVYGNQGSTNYQTDGSGATGLNGGTRAGNGAPSTVIQVPALVTVVLNSTYASAEWVGKASETEGGWGGHIAEIMTYPTALSAESIATIECYLGEKYAITLAHACP